MHLRIRSQVDLIGLFEDHGIVRIPIVHTGASQERIKAKPLG